MPTYDELRTTAFHLNPEAIERLGGSLGLLRFPREWLTPILDLVRRFRPNRKSVPIANLNMAIRALVPDVAAVSRNVGRANHPGQWLYCAGRPDIAGLEPIMHAWLRTSAGPEYAEEASRLWARLATTGLEWETAGPDEFGWSRSHEVSADTPGATEAVSKFPTGLFHLIPELLAAELLRRSERPDGFPRFRRCPSANDRGVELVSWPPLEHHGPHGRVWPFSYRIRLSVQTVPFQPDPVLHISVGLRRWRRTAPSTGRGRSANAYLLSRVPWISGLAESSAFRIAPLRWRRIDGAWTLRWRDELRDLFDQIAFERPLPDLADLTRDPTQYLTGQGPDNAVAIVHSTSGGDSHRVGPGASAKDRDQLTRWIGETLDDLISPVRLLPRVRVTLPTHREAEPVMVRARLAELAPDHALTIEIHKDTEAVEGAVRAAIVDDLGLGGFPSVTEDADTTWTTPELTVTIVTRSIGGLGAPLSPDLTVTDRRVRSRRAAQPRMEQVERALRPSPNLAVVELRGKEAFKDPGTDPKAALRVGFANAGRLTHFITPLRDDVKDPKNELDHRARASWVDLRTQLVGSLAPVRARVNGRFDLPDPVHTIAIYMLRRNETDSFDRHKLPIAVWTRSDDPNVYARTLGMTQWRPYHEALRYLATGKAFRLPDTTQDQTMSFVRDVVSSVRDGRPVLLLTWAQNLRLDWPDLKNTRLVIDRPTLDGTPVRQIAPELRHIAIRTHHYDETPECYGINEDQYGLPSGLFRRPGSHRVFASIAQKPASAKTHGSPMGSRIEERITKTGKAVLEDDAIAFNQQYVELTAAALKDGDDPVVWALIAHAQRRLANTYQDSLVLPVPLHLARKATKYAIPDADDDRATEGDFDHGDD